MIAGMASAANEMRTAMADIEDRAEWLRLAGVELDVDPTKNIGSLHEKIQSARGMVNKAGVVLYDALTVRRECARLLREATGTYERALYRETKAHSEDDGYKKAKTKDERESYILALPEVQVADEARQVFEGLLEDWDQFVKQVQGAYKSLADTRKDIEAQIETIRQQMFNGEIKPNPALGKLSGLAEVVGADVQTFLESAMRAPVPEEPPAVAPGQSGEVEW